MANTVQAVDGSSSVTASSTKNDGGTIVNAGAVASNSPITKVVSVKDLNNGEGTYGSVVVAKDGTGANTTNPDGVQAANSSLTGGLAYYPARGERNFLIRGASSKDGGAGVIGKDASNILAMPSSAEVGTRGVSDVHATIANTQHGKYEDRVYNILAKPSTVRNSVFTGRGTGSGTAMPFQNSEDTTDAVMSEIKDSRSVPGELTFWTGSKSPTRADYKARDSKES